MDDKIKITLKIAGINLPATITRDSEQMVRQAAKEVDVQFNRLMNRYGERLSKEQAMTIVAHSYALESLQLKEANETELYDQKVKELTKVLEACMKGV
ncbi:MAG: cell division protein ZapA [Prevotellaceae bacterium]|jgi:cell division protein ZapA|nr:cell division protein ZapA [Prevotellaceae bacterium]